jgi:hypothetical protein
LELALAALGGIAFADLALSRFWSPSANRHHYSAFLSIPKFSRNAIFYSRIFVFDRRAGLIG